jgi:hypothetical protein
VNGFFGDVRLIRNDYVHNKGLADEAVNVKLLRWGFAKGKPLNITAEQMISMIDLFPRSAVAARPTPDVDEQSKTSTGQHGTRSPRRRSREDQRVEPRQEHRH